jgi:hypothetical protein
MEVIRDEYGRNFEVFSTLSLIRLREGFYTSFTTFKRVFFYWKQMILIQKFYLKCVTFNSISSLYWLKFLYLEAEILDEIYTPLVS